MDELLAPLERMLDDGADLDAIAAAGFLDVLEVVTLAQAEPLIRAAARAAMPIGAAIVARAVASPSRALNAVVAAIEIAGALEAVLAATVEHANLRVQFGKPIARQQAVQQQLAVLAEHALLTRIAGQIGAAGGIAVTDVTAAVAKHVASAAVSVALGIAHAVHGAIGITAQGPLARHARTLHERRLAHGSESYWAGVLGAARVRAGGATLDFVRTL